MRQNFTFDGFEWDEGNKSKNWIKHNVDAAECEEVFTHTPLIFPDIYHSQAEPRWFVLGVTHGGRRLFITFTVRHDNIIRIISARDMNRKERNKYYAQIKKDSEI